MAKKILKNVKVGDTWSSYISCVQGALEHAGLWKGTTSYLMGISGYAFHFYVHKAISPSSVTVYDWPEVHNAMMDRIGIVTESTHVIAALIPNTFERVQSLALEKIKQSIDDGIPVVVWAPTAVLEFGLVTGYDDGDKVLYYVEQCFPRPNDPLLYDNLGRSQVPILFEQRFLEKVPFDVEKSVFHSLAYAVEQWKKEYHVNPDYHSGRKAYEALIDALEIHSFNPFGLRYIMAVYADSKKHIVHYLSSIMKQHSSLKGLEKALALYKQVGAQYRLMAELAPFRSPGPVEKNELEISRETIRKLLPLVHESLNLESQAVSALTTVLDNRR